MKGAFSIAFIDVPRIMILNRLVHELYTFLKWFWFGKKTIFLNSSVRYYYLRFSKSKFVNSPKFVLVSASSVYWTPGYMRLDNGAL